MEPPGDPSRRTSGARRHCERSEAIHGSAAARPAIGPRLVRSRRGSSKRLLHDQFWELVGGPSRGERDCFATLEKKRFFIFFFLLRLFHSRGSAEGPCRTNKKQRAQRSGKPALSYPRKRVSSGTRCGGARLAPGGKSKQPKFRQCRGILDARVRGHDTRETPHPGSGCLVQGDRPQAGNELAMTGSAHGNGNVRSTSTSSTRVINFWASPN